VAGGVLIAPQRRPDRPVSVPLRINELETLA
jgi:hypothetical protein